MLITSRCSGTFDRHRLDDQDFQFFDMFESSIGLVTDRESQLFSRFNRASAKSAEWLHSHRRRRNSGLPSFGSADQEENVMDQFPDSLLDIGVETSLLAEIKDIRDELSIITVILDAQLATLADFEFDITEELRGAEGPNNRRAVDTAVAEIRKRSHEQLRSLEIRKKDVERMDRQAQSLYMNLADLLDLKQKHSNALEARFAGDQAVIAAKQGQTIMVFTIVTIIFLPMSFIAAFFAINLKEWNTDIGSEPLTIPYVSKYMFGIGLGISIPLITMAFAITDISDATRGFFGGWKQWLHSKAKRRKGRQTASNTNDKYEKDILEEQTHLMTSKYSMGSQRERPIASRDNHHHYDQYHHHPQQIDDLSPRLRPHHSRDRSGDGYYATARLSPVSRQRKVSFSSGNANANANATAPWARPSLDRNRGRRMSEDLEKGRRAFFE
ncbi:uncharacterized protein F4822DRAFT_113604 [Hypoxylon trugodes]|uniref:uncharacterized protein n=1 Tax=Hypoxylon trugodes TaxID=326681 RepID=UPI00219D447D|nr:uncharacterized protein F4822DRAFT_113604 [Hypoxylon trugodes]KAI1392021.1 hypothetical protein F4822DRAFT_113604 [Hypoxylon trugodes]